MVTDRMSKGYEPRWDIDSALGKRGEKMVLEHFSKSHEVKTDAKSRLTNNLFIEYAQKRAEEDEFRPSGIRTSEADYWTYVSGEVIISAPKENWRCMVDWILRENPSLGREMSRGSHHSLGVIVPLSSLIPWLNHRHGP